VLNESLALVKFRVVFL